MVRVGLGAILAIVQEQVHPVSGSAPTGPAATEAPLNQGYVFEVSMPYLLNRVGVRLGRLFERQTREFGLTVPMYRVLAYLLHCKSSGLRELSTAVSIDASTLSRMVGTLTEAKMVVRTRRTENQRSVSIKLTDHGRAVVSELVPKAQEIELVIEQSVGADALVLLKEQLGRIYVGLDELDRGDPID